MRLNKFGENLHGSMTNRANTQNKDFVGKHTAQKPFQGLPRNDTWWKGFVKAEVRV